jgi:GNAT superfamily N-acetyltransferase
MVSINLRQAGGGDALLLSMLGTQVFLETYAPHGLTAALAREVHAHFSLPDVESLLAHADIEVWIAERAGHAVGFAQLHLAAPCTAPAPPPAFIELQRLYVQQAATGSGVGKALLQACERRAAGLGAGCLWLTAWVGNTRALGFYRHQGYADIGEHTYTFEGEAFENRVFAKRC